MILICVEEYGNMDKSMTVKELINHLKQYPDDEVIGTTWEGVKAAITSDNFELHDAK